MTETWLTVRVSLLNGRGVDCDPPPGRELLVGPRHTFADLADAIDRAFARWDLSHLHVFELPDGRSVGYPDDEMELEDQEKLRVVDAIRPGDVFTYTFDLGDEWVHSCIADAGFDPRTDWGEVPTDVVPIFGWGTIPTSTDARRTIDPLGCADRPPAHPAARRDAGAAAAVRHEEHRGRLVIVAQMYHTGPVTSYQASRAPKPQPPRRPVAL